MNFLKVKKSLTIALSLTAFTVFAQEKDDFAKDKASYPLGVAVNIDLMRKDPFYQKILKKEFNSITAENVMKWKYLQPEEGKFNWGAADSLVGYAQSIGAKVHGHCLVWHEALPDWVLKYKGNPEGLEKVMKKHIQTVVSHFKGKVSSWDVVNEAFADEGTGGRRVNIFSETLGPDYLNRAFEYARTVDGGVKLFYNEYGLENDKAKLEAVLEWIKSCKANNIPLDGIGLQCHVNLKNTTSQFTNMINKLKDTRLLIHISELDIMVNGDPKTPGNVVKLTPEIQDDQAILLKTLVTAYNYLPRDQRFGITFWGVSDRDSWIKKYYNRLDFPCLWDEKYKRKQAYSALYNTVK